MPNSPNVKVAPPANRMMSPRTALIPGGGVPANEALNNWQPGDLIDGALCYVLSENSLWVFRKFSTAAESASCIATCRGTGVPGRWFEFTAAASSKAYRAISYAQPNSVAPTGQSISALPQAPVTLTAFDDTINAVDLGNSGDLSFDGVHSIVAERAMALKIDWTMSYFISGGGTYYDVGVVRNGTTRVVGGFTTTYYTPVSGNQNVNIGVSLITSAAENDSFQLMVAILGSATDAVFVADHANLVITEL